MSEKEPVPSYIVELERTVQDLVKRVETLELDLANAKHDIEHPWGCECTSCY